MESGTIILAMVGFIGLFQVASSIEKVCAKSRSAAVHMENRTRNDWYCFFKLSSLYGPEQKQEEVRETLQKTTRDTIRGQQQRRIQANRPRVRA